MKKMNKKGFTLIELLAVIIILGVLMIIAIPSVTSYIQNSRKSAFVDSGLNYVKSGINVVNSGNKMRFYDRKTLYLIPAGHKAGQTCISLESGGQSPFSDDWAYAYVGVTYDGQGYQYYFIAEDGAGQGVQFLTQTDLQNLGADAVYSDELKNELGYKVLVKEYKEAGSDSVKAAQYGVDTGKTLTDILPAFTNTGSGAATEIKTDGGKLKVANKADAIERVVVLKSKTCKFQEEVTATS